MTDSMEILPVDVSNPGQFFACCGLMEIGALIAPEVEASFEREGFRMSVPADEVLRALVEAELEAIPLQEGSRRARGGQPHKIAPLHVVVRGRTLVLDWWLDDGISDFKNWSAGQSASGAALAMHAALAEIGAVPDVLDRAVPADLKPYYYDCRAGGNALDLGFMESGLTTTVYAATELLAFIGLQRFRPAPANTRWGRRYASWSKPLPVTLAAPTAACLLPTLEHQRWRFEMAWRDTSGRFKAFGRAHPEESPVPSKEPSSWLN